MKHLKIIGGVGFALILLRLNVGGELNLPWPGLALGLVICAIWLVPGLLLWHLVNRPTSPPPWFYWLPMSFAFGLLWLMGWAILILIQQATLDVFVTLTLRANLLLLLAYLPYLAREQLPSWHWSFESIKIAVKNHGLLLGMVGLMVIILLAIFNNSYGFTLEGDEWSLLPTIRRYIDGSPIFTKNISFDLWDFILALVVKLSGESLIEVYRFYLPLLFMVVALSSFMLLADTLLVQREQLYFAILLQGLYFLSDIHTDSNGVGLAFFARLQEDKIVAWLLIFPLAQAFLLKFLQQKRRHDLITFGLMAMLAIAIHPIAITWLFFSTAALSIILILTQPCPNLGENWRNGAMLALLILPFLAIIGWFWWHYTPLTTLTAPENGYLLKLNARRLWLFKEGLFNGSYMLHPFLLSHPFVILALLTNLTLLPKLKTDLTAQFLFANTFVVLLLLYNPLTVPVIGHFVTPWLLYRIGWILPVSLTLVYVIYPRLEQVATYLNYRFLQTPQLIVITLVCLTLVLSNPILTSWYSLNAWQPITITATQLDITQQIARLCQPNLIILASHEMNIQLRATTSQPRPMTARLYGPRDVRLLDTRRFLNTSLLNESLYNKMLPHYAIRYILTRQTDPIEPQLRLFPHLFKLLYANTDYSLYEWQAAIATPLELSLFKANSLLQQKSSVADQLYKDILQQNPTYLPAILGLAQSYEQQLHFDQALTLYQAASPQNDFARAWLQVKITQVRYRTNPTETASIIDSYRQSLTLAQGHEAIYQQVLAGYEQLSPEIQQSLAGQALRYALLEFYEVKAAREPRDYPRQYQLAQIYEQVGEKELAITQYTHITQQFVSRLEPYFKLAELQPDQATAWYQQALAHEASPPSGEANLRLAQFNYQQGQLAAATQFAQAVVQQGSTPTKAQAYQLLGEIYWEQKQLEPAINALLDAVQTQPNLAWGYVLLGNIYQEQHDSATALSYYRQAIQAEPQTALYHIIIGRALLANQQTEAGWAEIKLALNFANGASEIYQQVGELKAQYDSPKAAYPYFEQAVNLNSANSFAYLGLAQYHRTRGEFALAQQKVMQALAVATNTEMKVSSHVEQGQVYLAQQDNDAALREFLAALALKPNDAWLHGVIGDFYYHHQHNLAEAEKQYRQAADFPAWQVSLAEILLQNGQPQEAVAILQQVLIREPNSVELVARIKLLEKHYKLVELMP